MQFNWIFLKIFKYYFLQGNLRKTMKKTLKKNNNFLLKFSDLFYFFKVVLFICSNIGMLCIKVVEI